MSANGKKGIVHIAEVLGISPATVSRALRQETSHLVKEERRKEIIALADQMRFRPNPGARLIQKGAPPVISMIIPNDDDIFFSEYYGRILSGVLRSVAGTDWDVRISTLVRRSKDFVEDLRPMAMSSSGVIYNGDPLTNKDLKALADFPRPVVLLGSTVPNEGDFSRRSFSIVQVDNKSGAATAAKYIHQLGHRRIGIILGPDTSPDFALRETGYLEALEECGLPRESIELRRGSFDHNTGREACGELMNLKDRPTALICANDQIAFGALEMSKEMGINCPNQLSIIGFDDGPWATSCTPKLTTIRQPLNEVAQMCVNTLMRSSMASSAPSLNQNIELGTKLVIRESTAASPSDTG